MAFFQNVTGPEGEHFVPLADAASRWIGTHLRGPAITSLLVRGVEAAAAEETPDARPVRATFDLHSPVPMAPCFVTARVLKRGRTLTIAEAELRAHDTDRILARSRATFIVPPDAEAPAALEAEPVWRTDLPEECTPPPAELRALSAAGRLYRTTSTEWSSTRAGHQNADRHLVWTFDEDIIEGERPTRFQCAARAADLGNFVINMGADGLSYINTDVTLSLSRLPVSGGVGVCSELRSTHDGVAVGTAHLFDAEGACGSTTVTAVRHATTRLDYGTPTATH